MKNGSSLRGSWPAKCLTKQAGYFIHPFLAEMKELIKSFCWCREALAVRPRFQGEHLDRIFVLWSHEDAKRLPIVAGNTA